MNVLLENKKIANATHNILAYRIHRSDVPDAYLQDCDDDGETQAGSRLLHLLQVLYLHSLFVFKCKGVGI